MADIDIVAIKQFQAQWRPVMDAIPAVLEMAERKADLDRAMVQYTQDVEKVRQAAAKDQEDAKATLVAAQAELDVLKARMDGWVQDLAKFRRDAEAERAAADKSVADTLAEGNKRMVEVNAAIAGLDAEYALKRKNAEEVHAALLAANHAEIAAMEAVRVKTQKALDALRAQLG